MGRVVPKMCGGAAVLAIGLALSVWGWREFDKLEPSSPDKESGLRMCPPTWGEILEVDKLGRKMGFLTVAVVGMMVSCGSLLVFGSSKQKE